MKLFVMDIELYPNGLFRCRGELSESTQLQGTNIEKLFCRYKRDCNWGNILSALTNEYNTNGHIVNPRLVLIRFNWEKYHNAVS